jgi:micrococcal nuclease
MAHIRRPRPYVIAFFCCLILIACRVFGVFTTTASDSVPQDRIVVVAYVFDGDTIETSDGERVRLLGIDAPEIAHHEVQGEFFGEESTAWLRQRIGDQSVTLKFGLEPTDRYGRTLAWVFDSEGRLINEELLQTGNAVLLDRFGLPPEFDSLLRVAQTEAKTEKRGLWQ